MNPEEYYDKNNTINANELDKMALAILISDRERKLNKNKF